ncbi:hypothetical protein C2G38_2159799 [Gigaspora rosea]|uniref:Uncharacterized protein n=1 Tax=Gigaspora rosea TaxID=44941 RepID=A0A397W122_9GLOM|nr:hypothetical protein C2G38_2159799 [Gigaspora rosea]
MRDIVEKNCVVSRSGNCEQHQGLDAILKLRNNLFNIIGYNGHQVVRPRTQPELTIECQRFRIHLRSIGFVNQDLVECDLNANLKNFTYLAKQIYQDFIKEVFINKNHSSSSRPILITKQEYPEEVSWIKVEKKEELTEILKEVNHLVELDDANNQDYLEISELIRCVLIHSHLGILIYNVQSITPQEWTCWLWMNLSIQKLAEMVISVEYSFLDIGVNGIGS